MIWVLFWILGAAGCSFFANYLNRSPVSAFVYAIVISPILEFAFLLLAGTNGKACPKCAELVKNEASKCKHCGHEFEPLQQGGATVSDQNKDQKFNML